MKLETWSLHYYSDMIGKKLGLYFRVCSLITKKFVELGNFCQGFFRGASCGNHRSNRSHEPNQEGEIVLVFDLQHGKDHHVLRPVGACFVLSSSRELRTFRIIYESFCNTIGDSCVFTKYWTEATNPPLFFNRGTSPAPNATTGEVRLMKVNTTGASHG